MAKTTTSWLVGYWVEAEAREVTRCPSYYAADYEKLRTVPGRYPVYMDWRTGFVCPMAGDFHIGIDTVRIEGALFSGFGGLNFARRELPAGEAVRDTVHLYQFSAAQAAAEGRIEILPGREWLFAAEYGDIVSRCRTMTWDDVRSGAA